MMGLEMVIKGSEKVKLQFWVVPYFPGPLRNNSTTQNCIRTASGALITVSILLGTIRIPWHPSVKFKIHWEPSHSHIKILYHILKMIFC